MVNSPAHPFLTAKESEQFERREEGLFTEAWTEFEKRRVPRTDGTVREAVRARYDGSNLAAHDEWHSAYLAFVAADRLATSRRVENALSTLLCIAAAGVTITYALAALKHTTWLPSYHAQNWWFSALSLLVTVLLVTAARARRGPVTQRRERAVSNLATAQAPFYAALVNEVQALANSVINEHKERDKHEVATLKTLNAPILVEIDSADVVPSTSTEGVLTFIREHGTSAIGISGPRGIGKTTLMRDIQRHMEGTLSVYLPIPVSYAAEDFIRVIFREVASSVRAAYGDEREERQAQRVALRRIDMARAGVCVGLALVGVILFAVGRNGVPVFKTTDIPGLLLILIGLAGGAALVFSSAARIFAVSPIPHYHRHSGILNAARHAMHSLEFSHMQKRTTKNVFALKFFSAEDQDQFEQTERELTHPELVTKFKEFVSLYVQETKQRIVIGLDELDKIDKGKEALKFVNSIKDILHIRGVHFIVSVSEDALHSFSLRGVPVRDAFDSSFDAIVPVKRLDTAESQRLVNRRVLDFPDPLILFCHALSGGVPRDLIRSARQCIDVRRAAGPDTPVLVDSVVRQVVRRQSVLVCEALAARAKHTQPPVLAASIAAVSAVNDAAAETGSLVAALDHAAKQIQDASVDFPLGRDAAVYLNAAAALCSYFAIERTNEQWDQEEVAGTSIRVAQTVAHAIELLSFESEAGREALQPLRSSLGL
ncbi:ATP-binding protein [Streptomyces sp. NBC_00647]|uniref:ATP-binding protein n=1 Tax=Streptomyces sp. NBC_00647 TaxID=2975796 RepID=UPI00325168FC